MNQESYKPPELGPDAVPKVDEPTQIQKKTFNFSKSIDAAANRILVARIAELEGRGIISNAVARQLYSDRSFASNDTERTLGFDSGNTKEV